MSQQDWDELVAERDAALKERDAAHLRAVQYRTDLDAALERAEAAEKDYDEATQELAQELAEERILTGRYAEALECIADDSRAHPALRKFARAALGGE